MATNTASPNQNQQQSPQINPYQSPIQQQQQQQRQQLQQQQQIQSPSQQQQQQQQQQVQSPPQQQQQQQQLLMQQLAQLEQLAEAAYSSSDVNERNNAYQLLSGFSTDPACIAQCRLILQYSTKQYALLLASTHLLKLLTLFYHSFTVPQTVEIKNFLLNYLASQSINLQLPGYIITPIIQSVIRVAKLGWRLSVEHSDIVNNIHQFLHHSSFHLRLGLEMLSVLIEEMNTNHTADLLSEHRKTSRIFRDTQLQSVVTIALQTLQSIVQQQIPTNSAAEFDNILQHALTICTAGLQFDFIQAVLDDSADDLTASSVQIPNSWRTLLETPDTVNVFIEFIKLVANQSTATGAAAAASASAAGTVSTVHKINPQRTAQVIEVLGLLSSIRRSLFSSEEIKLQYLQRLCLAPKLLLTVNQSLLQSNEIFHSFCILLARLKTNHSLIELSKLPEYEQLLQYLSSFSLSALKQWNSTPNSCSYLLQLWARVCVDTYTINAATAAGLVINNNSTINTNTSNSLEYIRQFIPNLTVGFIQSRLDSIIQSVHNNELDDDFSEPQLSDQLKYLPALCRFEYDPIKLFIQSKIIPLIETYKQLVQANNTAESTTQQLILVENQLALLTYIIASIIGYPQLSPAQTLGWEKVSPLQTKDSQENLDAELCSWYFTIHQIAEFRLSKSTILTDKCLELARADIYFLQQFRLRFLTASSTSRGSYYLAHSSHSNSLSDSKENELTLFNRLSLLNVNLGAAAAAAAAASAGSAAGSTVNNAGGGGGGSVNGTNGTITSSTVMNYMLNVAFQYLSIFPSSDSIITDCIELLENLSQGFSTSTILIQLDSIKHILNNHSFDQFLFLIRAKHPRLHTQFYSIIGRLLFKGTNFDSFDQFMLPFDLLLGSIIKQTQLRTEPIANATISVTRKLQGLFESSSGSISYGLLFDWLLEYFPILSRLIETFYDNSAVVTAVLQLFTEVTANKNQRIRFELNSANGIILFKETAKILTILGNRILTIKSIELTSDELYLQKYKGISLCLKAISRLLSGSYINFGLMQLYNDKTLQTSVGVIIQLIMSIRLTELLSYPQLTENYYLFLDCLCRYHTELIINMESKVFLALLGSLYEGLQIQQSNIIIQCAAGLDALFTHHYTLVTKRDRIQRVQTAVNTTLASVAANNSGTSAVGIIPGSTGSITIPASTSASATMTINSLRQYNRHFDQNQCQLLLVDILTNLLNIYLFDPQMLQLYILVKPIFSLLVINRELLNNYQQRLAAIQPSIELRAKLLQSFQLILLKDIQWNLESQNRDKFNTNLNEFRAEITGYIIRPT